AFLNGHFAIASAELPIAAIGQGQPRALTILRDAGLDAGAEMEADREADFAALALAPDGNQQVLAAQFGALVAQDQDAPVRQAVAGGIAVVARLDPGRGSAALDLHHAPVDVHFGDARAD